MGFINLYMSEKTQKKLSERYGVRIGDIGIDFLNIADRDKFLQLLAKASAVKINDHSGIVHKEQQVSFGIYIRNTNEIGVRCHECEQIFYSGECSKVEYEYPYSYGTNGLSTRTEFICITCLDSKKKEVAEIKNRNLKEKEKLEVE